MGGSGSASPRELPGEDAADAGMVALGALPRSHRVAPGLWVGGVAREERRHAREIPRHAVTSGRCQGKRFRSIGCGGLMIRALIQDLERQTRQHAGGAADDVVPEIGDVQQGEEDEDERLRREAAQNTAVPERS